MSPLVIIESPYAGNIEDNINYARLAIKDSLSRGESPIASHLLYTQPGILDDNIPEQRSLGINAGLEWYRSADKIIFYSDKGFSPGMKNALKRAQELNKTIEYRQISP